MKLRGFALIGTALLSLVCAAGASAQDLWSNPATWGGQVPGPGAHVVVPQTRRIILDVTPPPLGSITVLGVLQFADKDIDLTVGWIMVHGLLEIGTEIEPYPHHATITLTGPLDEDVMGMGARFIGAMNGGVLEIHGSRRADVDWAVLSAHAKPGDTTIDLALVEPNKTEQLGWRPGDLLVIAPSGRNPLEAEGVTVTGVSGTQVSFTPPLRFHHWGELQPIAGRIVDQRAEVGLLTRNIVIQGASDGFARNMGGHVMIMAGSIGKLEGVELRNMGQMGRKGRYPIHWHLTGLAPTDYSRFNSIWNSFHRAVAVHQTAGVEVRGNVAANIWSHTYFVEDGNEVANIFEDNLGVLTKRLPDSAFAFARFEDAGSSGPAAQDEWRPATFWINNANNVVRRNRAAGGLDAIGFYYDNDHGRAQPGDVVALDFAGNVAHSYLASNPQLDPIPAKSAGVGLMVRMAPRAGGTVVFDNFTAYQNSVAGAWLEDSGDLLQNAILADNATGAVIFRSRIDGALIVGQTGNTLTSHPASTIRGGVRLISHLGGGKAPQVQRTTFVDQAPAAVYVESDHVMPGNFFEEITPIRTVPVFLRDRTLDHSWSGGLLDLDGSLTGSSASIVTGYALSEASVFMPGWGTFAPGGAFVTPQPPAVGPSGLSWYAEGSTVGFAWYAPDDPLGVESYVLEAGSGPGRADLAQADLGLTTTLAIPGVPDGTYFARVRARGPGGLTQASNEVQVVVGEPACSLPDPPVVTYGLAGNVVTLHWGADAGATSFVVAAGSASGRYDIMVTSVPATVTSLSGAVPPGTYVVRMAALNACGLSTLSNEVTIVVP